MRWHENRRVCNRANDKKLKENYNRRFFVCVFLLRLFIYFCVCVYDSRIFSVLRERITHTKKELFESE